RGSGLPDQRQRILAGTEADGRCRRHDVGGLLFAAPLCRRTGDGREDLLLDVAVFAVPLLQPSADETVLGVEERQWLLQPFITTQLSCGGSSGVECSRNLYEPGGGPGGRPLYQQPRRSGPVPLAGRAVADVPRSACLVQPAVDPHG